MQTGENEVVRLLVAPSQSGPALRAALQARTQEHGLTVLGSVVAWGYARTVDILAAACRQGPFRASSFQASNFTGCKGCQGC